MSKFGLCFIDLETTGLNPSDEIFSYAYALDLFDGDTFRNVTIESGYVEHTAQPSIFTLAHTNYLDVFKHDGQTPKPHQSVMFVETQIGFMRDFLMDIAALKCPVHLVGAQVQFDMGFLDRLKAKHFGRDGGWNFRLLEIESFIAGRLGMNRPAGLRASYEACLETWRDLPALETYSWHTAISDMNAVRNLFYALQDIEVPK